VETEDQSEKRNKGDVEMNIPVARPDIGQEEIDAVAEVLRSGMYTSGEKVKEFEKAFAEYVGTDHAVAVSNGTDALILTLYGCKMRPGSDVIVPALTFFATVAAPIHAGMRPVFADIDPETYCIDVESVKESLSRRTGAVIPVHLYGHPAAMEELNELVYEEYDRAGTCKRRQAPIIIEDAAQAHGAEYKGKKVGSLGHAACFSFFATKNMTTGEEGGMVTTDNGVVAKTVEVLRNHGMINRNDHVYMGYNNRLGEIGGAIGLIQLRKLDVMNAKRSETSEYLHKELGKMNLSWMKLPTVKTYVKHAWFWYPVLIDEDQLGITVHELRDFLKDAGIGTRHRYVEPLYKQPALMAWEKQSGIEYSKLELPNAEAIAGKMIGLPNHQGLNKVELDYILQTIKEMG
jgi:dTDP-4-amino-4,6-dideoxygalactose transaminase